MPISIGSRIGPYEITGLIGSGGMGTVFRARDTRLNRDVAIKLLLPSLVADDEMLRRFQVESQSASALNHPNILTVYDVGGADGHEPYLVTELLEGESLSSRLKRGKLTVAQAVDYAKQIACGLAAAHAKGIVHRDQARQSVHHQRRPGQDSRFRTAKVTSTQPRVGATISMVTTAGLIMGTAPYMSPEQARGQVVDARIIHRTSGQFWTTSRLLITDSSAG
jgi:serine/threonine protein kinase